MTDIKQMARFVGLSLLTKGLSVSPLKLQKILYYVQAWYMVFYGREHTLFAERPQAWVNGPVYPTVYREYRSKTQNMCDHLQPSDFCDGDPVEALADVTRLLGFDAEQLELLDSIIMLYGAKTQNQLIFLSHSGKPWAEKREGLPPYQRSEEELSLDTMYSYYKARRDRNREKA
jgi:uncharacterized phage-associated protein